MTAEEMGRFLASKKAVSAGERGYEYIMSWVAMNKSHFLTMGDNPELWGALESDRVYIIASKLRDALEDAGYSYNAILSWLCSSGKLVQKGGDRKSRKDFPRRINGILTRCVCLLMDEDGD